MSLGSNLGDRASYLDRARRALAARGARVLRASSVRETAPWGVTNQPAFLNQVLAIEWPGTPASLLEVAKAVECELGRTRTYRWGPREIDLDLLLYNDETIQEANLTVPHPRLHERQFLLDLLAEARLDILEE